ncbi:MAG TPA: hypothetical protein VH477_19025 [Bryobacteraceae bacterium]|jgi:hypothetical protein
MGKKASVLALMLSSAVMVPILHAQSTASGQDQPSTNQASQSSLDQQITMLRRDLRSQRKQIIAQNMNLTEAEAVKFWPIYDQYVSDLVEGNNAKYELIKEYTHSDTMTEQQADGLAKRWLTVDENVNQLRLKYLPKFRSALSAKQTARFYQLERRVQMMIDLQLASSIPLVGP